MNRGPFDARAFSLSNVQTLLASRKFLIFCRLNHTGLLGDSDLPGLMQADSTPTLEGPLRAKQGALMNWDRIEGNWRQIKGRVRQQWGKLTDDDLERIAGNRDELVGRLQERYGKQKDEVDREVKDWSDRL